MVGEFSSEIALPVWRRIRSVFLAACLCGLFLVIASSSSLSKVEGDKIILGAPVSLSGKYASSGLHTKNATISLWRRSTRLAA